MFQLFTTRLWARLVVLFVLISALPILLAGVLATSLLERRTSELTRDKQALLADLSAGLVRDYLERCQSKLDTVARLLEREFDRQGMVANSILDENRATVVQRLSALVDPPDLYLELEYYGGQQEDLRLLADARQQRVEQVQERDPNYEAVQSRRATSNIKSPLVQSPVREGQSFIGKNAFDNFGFNTVPLSVAVGTDRRNLGALVAYVDLAPLEGQLARFAEGGYHVRLLDDAGEELAAAGDAPADPVSASAAAGWAKWRVEVSEPSGRLYGVVDDIRRQGLLWTGLAVLVAVLSSVLFASWIVRPVRTLTEAADAMRDGDLSVRARLERADEIGRLGEAFDHMAESVESLDAAKSEFVGNASHELRTPLTSMRLSIANLREGVLGPLGERQVQTVARLGKDVDRMVRLVEGLLELARLEAGGQAASPVALDLRRVVESALEGLAPQARERGVAFDVTGEGEAFADPDLLGRVLTNLVDNALKFSPAGGRVHVELAPGRVLVRDEGPGFDDEGLFDKFRQGSQDGVKNPGAGLGLSIARKLLELQSGRLRLLPGEGGARLEVQLPTEAK